MNEQEIDFALCFMSIPLSVAPTPPFYKYKVNRVKEKRLKYNGVNCRMLNDSEYKELEEYMSQFEFDDGLSDDEQKELNQYIEQFK